LDTSLFIAQKIVRAGGEKQSFSKPIIKIAILGIALGIAVMLLAIAIVTGFKSQIRDKVIGFGSHIQILHYDTRNILEPNPIEKNQDFISYIKNHPEIDHIQMFANKPGIIKTSEDMEGVLLKGIGEDFNWEFFNNRIIEGSAFSVTDTITVNDILISKNIADKLRLNVGDNLQMYFVQQPPRVRKFTIKGIYQTGMEEFDKLYVIGDIKHVQRLNDWDENYISGFEVLLYDFRNMDAVAENLRDEIGLDLNALTIKDLYPQIFDWLDLQDINVKIILILMILVAGINMTATLLIIILERTRTIGILKALGMKDFTIQKIFLYNAAFIIGKGLFWGNLFGLGISYLQYEFNIIKLDEASYYIKSVPIDLSILSILLLNAGTLIACLLMLLIPSFIISRITPVKAIRFS
jgi:lipoprotein-releasing system permease protein